MKKHYHTILAALMILIIGGLILLPGVVSADTTIIEEIAVSGINNFIATVANFLLGVTAWFVAITGTLLNVSIILTMRIKDLYTEIDSIRMVWVTIRDLSSIFIIFLLLYAAIKMILGVSSSDFGKLVVKIFLAGIFINFSLFFVKVAVDASNLVSLQFYNAIAPGTSRNMEIGKAISDGGISNVFMQSLQLPKIYQNKEPLKSTDVFASIGLAAIGGMILMVTAAFSFLAASLAFIARTGILLFVMALSPILVIGMIFPEVKSKFKTLFDVALGQLFFMPAYLGLMYVALRFISDPKFTNIFNPSITGTPASQGVAFSVSIGVIIQYTIAIIFINAPLVAAISLSGTKGWGMAWAPQMGTIAGRFGGFIGRNSAGRLSALAGKGFDSMAVNAQKSEAGRLATKALRLTRISQSARAGLKKGEEGKYGGVYSLDDIEKEDKAHRTLMDGKRQEQKRKGEFDALYTSGATPTREQTKLVLSKMSNDQIEGLGAKELKKQEVAAALSTKQMEAVLKSTKFTETDREEIKDQRIAGFAADVKNISSGDMENILKEDFSDSQKKVLKDARKQGLDDAVATANSATVAEYMKKLSTKELVAMLEANGSVTAPDIIIEQLKPNQLKEKDMEGMREPLRKYIGERIWAWGSTYGGRHHAAFDHVQRNMTVWV